MILLIKLLLAHFIADFFLQPGSWVKDKIEKKARSTKLALHILVHAAATALAMGDASMWVGWIVVVVSHYIIDLAKLYNLGRTDKRVLFFLDQALHLLVLLAVAQYYDAFLHYHLTDRNVVLLGITTLMIVLLTNVGSMAIKALIAPWSPRTEDRPDQSLERAGRYIGVLERLFVFGFVALSYLPGIGFLLAAKSIFRFGDLRQSRDRKLTEYVLIGTLLSFGYAMLLGLIYNWLRSLY